MSRTVGAPVSRFEGTSKVTGEARYAAEFPHAGLAYGWIVQSTIARGRVESVDAGTTLQMPGVLAVVTATNA
ncbi:MAG: xanthine dehydrogenase YagR molybdenum-binding subunit, partial [Acidimicrobiaceae bacterium]|nr:xanthine dehydrogenase YagR molybdenum-binding subunit [Acidimicrobiaceae bacterium]